MASGSPSSNRNIAGSQLGNLSFAIQDIITVMQYGGSFERAMLAAGNNIGFIATAFGGVTGAIAGVVGTLAVGLLPKLLMGATETKKFTDELKELESVLSRLERFKQLEISIRQDFEAAGLQEDIFGDKIPVDQRAENFKGVAEQREQERIAEVGKREEAEDKVANANLAIQRNGVEAQQRFISQLADDSRFGDYYVPQFGIDAGEIRRFEASLVAGRAVTGEEVFDKRLGFSENRFNEAGGFNEVVLRVQEELQKKTPEELGRLGIDIFTDEDKERMAELAKIVAEAAQAAEDATVAEKELVAARQKAVAEYELAIEAATEEAFEEKQKKQDRDIALTAALRHNKKLADDQREQEAAQRNATRESLSQYEARKKQIIGSEESLLKQLDPEAAKALEVDKLLKPLQAVFGKQNPGAFAEIREELLKPQAAEISGQFAIPNFVSQLTDSLLEKDTDPIQLSPEAMDLLGKIEDHLRGLEGLGVQP